MAAPNLYRVHPKLRTIARNLPRVAASQGFQVRITSGWRSYENQRKLYNDYVRGISHYPVNYPGTSTHEKGKALDILTTNLPALVGMLTSVGLQWAGPGDEIHFEMPTGRSRTQKVAPVKGKGKGKVMKIANTVADVAEWLPVVGTPITLLRTAFKWLF